MTIVNPADSPLQCGPAVAGVADPGICKMEGHAPSCPNITLRRRQRGVLQIGSRAHRARLQPSCPIHSWDVSEKRPYLLPIGRD